MKVFVPFLLLSTLFAEQSLSEVDVILRKGESLVATGHFSQAKDLYEHALRQYPANPNLAYDLAMVYFHEHDWARAIDNYKKSLTATRKNVLALFYLGEAYFMNGDLDSAREAIAQAANINPDDAQICQKYGEYLALTLDTRKQAIAWLEKARSLNSGLEKIDFEIGKAQFDLTYFQDAIPSFEKALKKNPENGEAAFFLAESQGRIGDWKSARTFYNYALTHTFATGPVYYGLGRSLVQTEDYQAALAPLQSALAVDPSLIQSHFQLGNAYRHLNRSEDADRETRLYADLVNRTDTSKEFNGPDEQQIWKKIKPLIEKGNEQAALDYLSMESNPDFSGEARRYYVLGAMYFSLGKRTDAIRALKIARDGEPTSSRVAAYLGIVQLSSDDPVGAEQSFRAALDLDSTEAMALIGMGTLSYQQRHWNEAIGFIEKSRTSDAGVLYMLCDAYLRTGQTENALRTAEITRAFASNRKDLRQALDDLLKHQ